MNEILNDSSFIWHLQFPIVFRWGPKHWQRWSCPRKYNHFQIWTIQCVIISICTLILVVISKPCLHLNDYIELDWCRGVVLFCQGYGIARSGSSAVDVHAVFTLQFSSFWLFCIKSSANVCWWSSQSCFILMNCVFSALRKAALYSAAVNPQTGLFDLEQYFICPPIVQIICWVCSCVTGMFQIWNTNPSTISDIQCIDNFTKSKGWSRASLLELALERINCVTSSWKSSGPTSTFLIAIGFQCYRMQSTRSRSVCSNRVLFLQAKNRAACRSIHACGDGFTGIPIVWSIPNLDFSFEIIKHKFKPSAIHLCVPIVFLRSSMQNECATKVNFCRQHLIWYHFIYVIILIILQFIALKFRGNVLNLVGCRPQIQCLTGKHIWPLQNWTTKSSGQCATYFVTIRVMVTRDDRSHAIIIPTEFNIFSFCFCLLFSN